MDTEDVPREAGDIPTTEFPIRVLIISDVRFLRESLEEILAREGILSISGLFANLHEALPEIADGHSDIVVLDGAFPDGSAAVGRIRDVAPQISVVVIAVTETAENIISWAEAGIAGYIPRSAGTADIVPLLVDIMRGKQACMGSVAAGLIRRLSNGGTAGRGHDNIPLAPMLTEREAQIAQLIVSGMSNKDIARRLNIGVATAKTHVHNLLGKLNLHRRGQAAYWMREHREHW